MKPSTKDRVEGTLHEAKGPVVERAGQLAFVRCTCDRIVRGVEREMAATSM